MTAATRTEDRQARTAKSAPRRTAGDIDWAAIKALRIRRLVSDSRAVAPGDAFAAYPGETRDGRDFIPEAIGRGAGAVLWERQGFSWNAGWRVGNVGVPRLRRHAGEIAAEVYGRPSASLWMAGVTGTNGKTSCSHWIAQSLARLDTRCGVIGTLGSGWPGRLDPLVNTTPDAVWLQERLGEFVKQKAQAVSMEVSSHGLAQDRVSGVEFDVALFTNLTRDHLDYHRTMRSYRSAKARLFRWPRLRTAVLNFDDAFGAVLAGEAQAAGASVLGYGFERALPPAMRGRRAQRLVGRNLRLGRDGLAFEAVTPWGNTRIESGLIGRFNAVNLLATLGVLLAADHALDAAAAALSKVTPVPGRTERYGGGRRPLVVVDYAHTPDALENVLHALRDLMNAADGDATRPAQRRKRGGKLVCVFGCGGDRDRGKRPLMGRIASRLADEVIVTTDNPRTEDPHRILTDILEGTTSPCAIAPDRSQAIRAAIAGARSGDVVLVAGKGHEQYQEIDGVRHPYSDAAVVREVLAERAR